LSNSSIKTGSTIIMAMAVYALVISLLWIFITEVMFVSDYLAVTGQSLTEAIATGSQTAQLWLTTKRFWGIALLTISILIIGITSKSYSKGEKWSWYTLLVSGSILWGSLIGYKMAIGYFQLHPSSMTFIVGAILFVIGLVVPAKTIFSKKTK
jgi:uncharacterized membrane protein YiaA